MTSHSTPQTRIRELRDQAQRLDAMGFGDTANLYRGLAVLADAVLTAPVNPRATITRTQPFIGVVKGGRS